ncbi:MTRF1L release factor glutamine methyltransferase-like isoform X1 [Acipenser ruthenus]|uniref:MTRF1L release factor glutamine methyltransferase-like isoform X1 n=1 Tax=Acipenser ruthenus TaxID=7906 RepID=UPI002741C185|nr:MTRF1L release factor glutamine methyltransferase-like isoform X1 [Acipenser ruthenus]XP_058844215.1 MTRF1L release factor glutamine methyltransferase-like isoform X1 [Acipenser ruthenus]
MMNPGVLLCERSAKRCAAQVLRMAATLQPPPVPRGSKRGSSRGFCSRPPPWQFGSGERHGAPCAPPARPLGADECVSLWEQLFSERGVSEPRLSSEYIVAHVLGAKTMQSLRAGRQEQSLTETQIQSLRAGRQEQSLTETQMQSLRAGRQEQSLTETQIQSLRAGRQEQSLTETQIQRVWELCSKRLQRMPVQYVIEEWDFRELTLKMRPPVFIPRPETEELVGLVMEELRTRGSAQDSPASLQFLEVGCGSGAVSLSLLHHCPQCHAVAVDRSSEALDLTRENAERLGVLERLQIVQLDVLLDADSVLCQCGSVDFIVSNPPYVFAEDLPLLEPEILWYEDQRSLDGGEGGMDVIKQILCIGTRALKKNGKIFLEVDPRHPLMIQEWLRSQSDHGLEYRETHRDFTGRSRFCVLQKTAPEC